MRPATERGLTRRRFLAETSALGAASLIGLPQVASADPPPEISRIRLLKLTAICTAPQYLAKEMLRLEGFSDVEHVAIKESDNVRYVTAKQVDVTTQDAPTLVAGLDAGDPIVVLAGLHAGCYELFASKRIRSIPELKGNKVAISGIGQFDHRFLSSILAYVGLHPGKDIRWIEGGNATEAMALFADGNADAFFAFPSTSSRVAVAENRACASKYNPRPSVVAVFLLHGHSASRLREKLSHRN
jgi:NitT/TauT family transport system substrate-binding protein